MAGLVSAVTEVKGYRINMCAFFSYELMMRMKLFALVGYFGGSEFEVLRDSSGIKELGSRNA